ncbi:hypothetical protein ABIA54_004760 [Pseudomonas sp. EB276 TE3739]|nr:hypothetical protein [Pseudomonas koreensis]
MRRVLPIDDSSTERGIKAFLLGHKASLFSDTPKGATSSAQIYSLVGTAKVSGYEVLLPYNCSPEMS